MVTNAPYASLVKSVSGMLRRSIFIAPVTVFTSVPAGISALPAPRGARTDRLHCCARHAERHTRCARTCQELLVQCIHLRRAARFTENTGLLQAWQAACTDTGVVRTSVCKCRAWQRTISVDEVHAGDEARARVLRHRNGGAGGLAAEPCVRFEHVHPLRFLHRRRRFERHGAVLQVHDKLVLLLGVLGVCHRGDLAHVERVLLLLVRRLLIVRARESIHFEVLRRQRKLTAMTKHDGGAPASGRDCQIFSPSPFSRATLPRWTSLQRPAPARTWAQPMRSKSLPHTRARPQKQHVVIWIGNCRLRAKGPVLDRDSATPPSKRQSPT